MRPRVPMVLIAAPEDREGGTAALEEHLGLLSDSGEIDLLEASTHGIDQADVVVLFLTEALLQRHAGLPYYALGRSRAAQGWPKIVGVLVDREVQVPADLTAQFVALLPQDGRPVAAWRSAEDAWLSVARGLQQALDAARAARQEKSALAGDPIDILFLSASPQDTTRLAHDLEQRRIERSLRRARYGRRFRLISVPAVEAEELPGLLREQDPHLLHLSAHTTKDRRIVAHLKALLALRPGRLRGILLNTSYPAEAADALAEIVGFCIGYNDCRDDFATAFAAAFYEGLADGLTLQEAFKLANVQASLQAGGQWPHLAVNPIHANLLSGQPWVDMRGPMTESDPPR